MRASAESQKHKKHATQTEKQGAGTALFAAVMTEQRLISPEELVQVLAVLVAEQTSVLMLVILAEISTAQKPVALTA